MSQEIKESKTGTLNMKEINDAIKTIEIITHRYKRKKMSTETYIKTMHENLSRLTNERDYLKYLSSIGQLT